MPRLQELIHALELGAGARYLRLAALLLGVITLAVIYDVRELQNIRSEEAMDAAQVGRNLAEGRGFTTRYVRPLSIGLITQHRADRDPLLKGEHPDLANPPLYPLLLSGFMKIPGLFQYEVVSPKEGQFLRHQPDLIITLINQGLFFIGIALIWRLARRLFDARVATLTTLLMLGSEVLWQFSGSGHATMLALVLVAALFNVLQALDAGARQDPPRGGPWLVGLALLAGLCCGLLALTRYSLGLFILPVLVLLAAGFPGRRVVLPLAAGVVFLAVLTPWLVRNWQICGNPFGIAAYALVQETNPFGGNWLPRTFNPELGLVGRNDIVRKLFVGLGQLLSEDLPEIGGSWITAFFLVGLLVPFVDARRSRLRWFTLGSLVVLGLAQVMARTHLSTEVPRIHSENLLVLLAPVVFMFGSALLVLLVYSLDITVEAWRRVILGGVVAVLWIPLLVFFGPPRSFPIAYPPYYPPIIHQVAQWFEPDELIMSDMPWAVAWYGNRQSVLLTRTPDKDFLDLSDWQKEVNGLYLTRLTLDQRFLSGWVLNAKEWGRFVIEMLTEGEVPKGFPLRSAPPFLSTFPHYLLLADRERWEFAPSTRALRALESKDPDAATRPGEGESTAP